MKPMSRIRTALLLYAVLPLAIAMADDNTTVTPLGSFAWTNTTSVSVYNNIIIATTPQGVMSLLQGDPQSYLPLPSSPVAIRQYQNEFLVQTRSGELFLITVNDNAVVILLCRFDPGNQVLDYAFDGNSIYLARGFDGVSVYDYDYHGAFRFRDSSTVGVHYNHMVLRGNLLITVDDYNGIISYDLTGGDLQHIAQYLPVPYHINDLAIGGRFLAATTEDSVMLGGVIDWQHQQISRFEPLGTAPSHFVYFHDSTATAVGDDGVRMYRWYGNPTIRKLSYYQITKPIRTSIGVGPRPSGPGQAAHTYASAGDGTIISFLNQSNAPIVSHAQITNYSAPYTQMKWRDSVLLVGGPNFPLQGYHLNLDDRVAPPSIIIPGMVNVGDFDLRHDTLMVLSLLDRAVQLFRLTDTAPPLLIRSIPVDTTQIYQTRFIDWPTDTMTVIGMAGANHLLITTIRDTLPTEVPTRVFLFGRVVDYLVNDSDLLIMSNKRVLEVYRLHDDLTSDFQGSMSLPVDASTLTTISGLDSLSGVEQHRAYITAGTTLNRLDLSDPAAPDFDLTIHTGFHMSQLTIFGDTAYAVGTDGLGLLVLDGSTPISKALGGRDGNLVSRSGNLLATTDGESVDIYRLPKDISTDVGDQPENLPVQFSLKQNWPNPFNPRTTIAYDLAHPGRVRLSLFNMLGQEIAVLADGIQGAGYHAVSWEGTDAQGRQVASGLYFYRLEQQDRTETKKLMLLR